jgi:RNA polymerase sigma-70 factor (ECF subfamily)
MELEPRDREIVILKIEHGRSYKEIAEIMGISVTNVGFILHTAIKKLAKSLNTEAMRR